MFEVGFSEILLIFAIALLVLGPEKLPKLAADLGRWAGRARAMARQLRTQLEQEVQYDPMKDAPAPARTIHSPAVVTTPTAAPAPDASRESSAGPTTAAAAATVTEPTPAAMGGSDEPKPA
jgi:sec-independent protein translocase protein TatB